MKNIKSKHEFFASFLLLFQILTLLNGCTQKTSINSDLNSKKSDSSEISYLNAVELVTNKDGLSNLKTIIKTTNGNITLRFYSKNAPNTVTRFLHLVQDGFYDGLKFHRVIENFVVQSGDPTGSGKGGSGVILKAEISSLQHIKGTVAMARSHNDIDSADSQFYIALTSLPHLDGQYTIFAQVVDGFDVLDNIKQDDKILSVHILNN